MDELLLFLAEKGALDSAVHLTTKMLGTSLSMSQQNASVRLRNLESDNLISRTEQGICVTKEGRKALETYYSRLGSVLRQKKFVFSGRVVPGFEKALPIPLNKLIKNIINKERKKDKQLLIFDQVGKQVRWVMYHLEDKGYKDYYFLSGGATEVLKEQKYR